MIDIWSFVCHSMLGGECTCVITSELANQCVLKALFTYVIHTNAQYSFIQIICTDLEYRKQKVPIKLFIWKAKTFRKITNIVNRNGLLI